MPPFPKSPSPRANRRRIALLAMSGLLLLGSGAAAATQEDARQATDVAPAASPRMQHPAKGYAMVIVYFQIHGADINLDALDAITLAAQKAQDIGSALVVTCHDA